MGKMKELQIELMNERVLIDDDPTEEEEEEALTRADGYPKTQEDLFLKSENQDIRY